MLSNKDQLWSLFSKRFSASPWLKWPNSTLSSKFLQLDSPLSSSWTEREGWNVISNSFSRSCPCLFYTKVTDVWIPAVVPSTLNGTFTVFAPTEVALLLEAITSPARVSNWLKTRMLTHVHKRLLTHTQTCSNARAHILSIKLLHLHIAGWLPTRTPSVQQTDSTCLQLMDLHCHIFTSPGRNKLCFSVCISMCTCSSFHFSQMRSIELVGHFQHSHSESIWHKALMASHGGKLLAAC